MAVRKLRSKIFRVVLSVVLLLVLSVAALPLWFPWVLRPIAKRFGADYAHYQRVGYQRFQVSDFTLTNGAVHLEAREATAFVPTVWLWRHFTGSTSEPFLQVQSWKYVSVPAKSAGSNAPVSIYAIFQKISNTASTLEKWLPTATLTNGTISIKDHAVEVPWANWANAELKADASQPGEQPIAITVSTIQSAPWKLTFDSEAQEFHLTISVDDRNGKLGVKGAANWLTNHVDAAAEFPPHGFIPETASLHTEVFTVPARFLGWEQYGDLNGALRAEWQTNHFNLQLAAKAVPHATNLPPSDIELQASGDTNTVHLELARISTPGLQAGLAAPVAISFQPPFLSRPATLNLAADLDQQHWFLAHGKLTGQAVVYPGDKLPRVSFTLSGMGAATTSVTTSNLQVAGELDWPVLDLQSAHIGMDDASQISFSGKYDFKQKTIRDGRLSSSGAFGGQFLPADFAFDSASITAQFGGPLNLITNAATVAVKHFVAPHINPMDVEATWNGEGLNFKTAQVSLKAGGSSLLLRGSAALGPGERSIALTTLDLSNSNHVQLRLQQPARMAFGLGNTNELWSLAVEPLLLLGDDWAIGLTANVAWPQRGTIQCEARGLDARLFKDFIPQADSEAVLDHFDFSGGWTNGPIAFQLALDATLKTKEQLPFSASARLVGGKDGISIEKLFVLSTNQTVCRVDGSLPIILDLGQKDELVQINADAPLRLRMLTDPKSVLWEKIAAATGLRLQAPNLAANLEGTWAAPKGEVTMRVERIELSSAKYSLPTVEDLDFLMEMDRASARVSRLNFEIEKQPVTITGQIPLGETFWSGLWHKQRLPDWHNATAHLKIENAQIAPFAHFLPGILGPEGNASADVSLQPGGNLHGELSLTNARTPPLESIGPVRNIQLVAQFDGRKVQLKNASGEIGGQRVDVDGGMEVNERLWQTNGLPSFHVHVAGTNVPLARNLSVLLRADLDLAATNEPSGVPTVSGTVRLRDSLLLADLQTLVPERTASPRRRPPYFSVELEPWAQSHIKINVVGDSFLRVQTPLFRGKVSTVMTLEGTLKDPVALGQVKIDPGSFISFPFTSLDVRQGFISLTSEDPYHPNLFVTAQGRRFGYDVKLEVTGHVDQPVVQFSSIPGLSSEEIVLMLTAGQAPRGTGYTATTQQRAQGLGLFVGKNLLADFGIGGGEQMIIHSGEEISEQGRPTYGIEFKLTDRWSVIGEYDRFDQYNLNVKFKAYSR